MYHPISVADAPFIRGKPSRRKIRGVLVAQIVSLWLKNNLLGVFVFKQTRKLLIIAKVSLPKQHDFKQS
jgi:hypothetical protein